MCARNLAAERKLVKYFWLSIGPAIILLLALVSLFIFGRR